MGKQEIKLILSGLTCANCANKIEKRVNDLEYIEEANLNFATSTLLISGDGSKSDDEIVKKAKEIINKLEPEVIVYNNDEKNIEIKNKDICTNKSCNNIKKHEHGHSHEDGHSHEHNGNIALKDNLSLVIGIIVYVAALFLKSKEMLSLFLFILSYILIGGKVVLTAVKNILRGEVFDENFLMSIATLGAFFVGEYPEAVAVMLFYEIGELFQGYAVNRSRKSITSLMNIRAEYANVIRDEKEIKVKPEEVDLDEIIIIKNGERVPLDGVVIEGQSFLDTSALTGESVPREAKVGDEVLSGAINTKAVLRVKVRRNFKESTVSRIIELVENASNKKAKTEKFITKFARIYTPIVVFCALALAIIPPIIIKNASFSDWIYRALIFLVVSCPCALVVSIPLGLFAGIGGASKKGILVKGGNYLEALKDIDTIMLDKTGTLTKGIFKVSEINAINIEKDKLLELAAISESLSNHPIAQSIIKEYGKEIDSSIIKDYEEISGYGIKANIGESSILLGNHKLMNKFNIKYEDKETIGTIVHISINNEYKGNIIISDEIKDNAKEAINNIKSLGILETIMLTGDNKYIADKVGRLINIDKIYSELLPQDKVQKVEETINNKKTKGKVAFVGDGINDAPVLARADIGIAMGGIGSDAAIEAADVVLMNDDINSLSEAIKIARKTNTILWQNIIFSLSIKILVLILGAFGIATMWEAVFADVGVTLIAVLNSTRCLK